MDNTKTVLASLLYVSLLVGCGGGSDGGASNSTSSGSGSGSGDGSGPHEGADIAAVKIVDSKTNQEVSVIYSGASLSALVMQRSTPSFVWRVDAQTVSTDITYTVTNRDWLKSIQVCASSEGNEEVCSNTYPVLARMPLTIEDPSNYVVLPYDIP
ncbi:hypothetical protein GCM10007938_07120 [Vibrio zhanjiangensis]|uniref:Lipoprotein n=1 Tax=Vibrio zhanjiangensis TaxID=1046128 RepID=A0ABQ6EWH8_9VIBR|nr:hypothetical protein [Vibrio zhanjiangensis]GLT16935.1 hypothetical protein GCM10007938_07120 [Vibrio zhanjiangensis]